MKSTSFYVGKTVQLNKAQQVAHDLLDRVIRDGLVPGSSFGTEAELLEEYNVSRPTMRESLRILESQGVVSLRPGPKGGIIITKPSIDVLAHAFSVFLRLYDVPIEEILRARMAIEPALVRDAALHGSEEIFAEMEESIERMAAADDDGPAIFLENRKFHNLIAKAAGNPVLEVYWLTIRTLASGESDKLKFSARNRAHIVEAHREILAACRNRDPHAAQVHMEEHLGELELFLRKRKGGGQAAPIEFRQVPART